MRLIWLALFVLFGLPSAQAAQCQALAAGTSLADAAKQLFNCSSARPLTALPAGDREFQVHFDFPTTAPTISVPWSNTDFTKDPQKYLAELLDYGVAANDAVDWRIEDAPASHWCHAPWFQAQRERIHGMTRERGSRAKMLGPLQTDQAENWAVGFYNPVGCYGLGQVWADPASPKTKGFRFPANTYSIKLLFSAASLSQVPYLTGSKEWNAAIGQNGEAVKMRLLQVDVAAKDPRADQWTGWVFGTFIYDAYAPGETVWEKLVPVGLMWGNDEQLDARAYEEQGKLPTEGWLNPAVAAKFYNLPRHTLGLFERVNGPVDNPKAACLACHGRAIDWGRGIPSDQNDPVSKAAAQLLPLAIDPYDEDAFHRYFRNLKSDEPFVEGTQALDYSLQLAGGLFNFRRWVDQNYPAEAAATRDVPPYDFGFAPAPAVNVAAPAAIDALQLRYLGTPQEEFANFNR